MKFKYIVLALLCTTGVQAQIEVSGPITTNTTWGETSSLYLVVGDVTVTASTFLTILPGVEVRFMGDYKIEVSNGGLIANGTETDSIRFVFVVGLPGNWKWLEFNEVLGSSTTLSYCRIESGQRAAKVNNCRVNFDHCLIRGHSLSPIRGDNAQIYMTNCTITQNQGSGIYALNSTTVHLTDCAITYNSGNGGINAQTDALITVTGGCIKNNDGSGIYGIQPNVITLEDVEIGLNGEYGISLTWCDELEARRVLIHNNEYHGMLLASTPLDAYKLTISSNGYNGINFSGAINHLLKLHSSIIDHNEEYGIYLDSGIDFLSYNDAYLNALGNYHQCDPGAGSIEEDPQYVDFSGFDFHLQEGSLCIDAGNPIITFNDPDGTRADMGAFYFDQTPGAVQRQIKPEIISTLSIVTAYPNPFNPVLTIKIQAQKTSTGRLEAWTANGRLAARIWEGSFTPGVSEFSWQTEGLASGRYFIRLKTGKTSEVFPCVLIK